MTGKEKCKQLKRYRNTLAKVNGIDFKSKECNFEGECPGFCPACDEEILFLENELHKKEQSGCSIKMRGLLKLAFKNGDKIYEYEPVSRGLTGIIEFSKPKEIVYKDKTISMAELNRIVRNIMNNSFENDEDGGTTLTKEEQLNLIAWLNGEEEVVDTAEIVNDDMTIPSTEDLLGDIVDTSDDEW